MEADDSSLPIVQHETFGPVQIRPEHHEA